MAEHHRLSVEKIADRVKEFSLTRKQFRIYHGATSSTRASLKTADNVIDTSMLDNVLLVDKETNTALVEPNVPMDRLVEATLAKGLVPLVVMEFPGITAGGGFSGTSGESSSFRYGPFESTVNWIEIVTGKGEVMRAYRNKEENTDLFWGAASSFGTLGVVTLLEIQLKPCKPFVKLTYTLHTSPNDANAKMDEAAAREDTNYVDAIMFDKKTTVVCSGSWTEFPGGYTPVVRLTRSWDDWFYSRVWAQAVAIKDQEDETKGRVDFIPLTDYLFRYDRGAFWVAKYSFEYFKVPFWRITRFLLDPVLHTRQIYHALHKSGLGNYYLVQDVGVPHDKVDEFTNWLEENFGIYPLWLCPLLLSRSSPGARHGLHAEFANLKPGTAESKLMNFGVWGPVPGVSPTSPNVAAQRAKFVEQNRLLEKKVHELGGKKWLYAQAFYTEEEFWAHYDRKAYDSVRAKYGSDWLPTVYEKVRNKEADFKADTLFAWLIAVFWSIWPLRGIYGVIKLFLGGDYLLTTTKSEGKALKDKKA